MDLNAWQSSAPRTVLVFPAGLLIAGVAIGLAGCGGSDDDTSAASAPTATATSGTQAPTTSPSETATPPAAPAKTSACPVTASVLLTALKGDSEFGPRSTAVTTLTNVECYEPYAMAAVPGTETMQGGMVLFRHDPAAGTWHPVSLGSADICEGHVPPEIKSKFKYC
jgi:hypothetical protein